MPEQLQFDKTIRKVEPIFRYAGINIKCGEKKPNERKKCLFVYIFNNSFLIYTIGGGIIYFIDGVKKGKDFFGLTFIAPCIALGSLSIMKSLSLIYHAKTIDRLMENLRQLERDENSRKKDVVKEKITATDAKYLHIALNVLNILYGLLLLTFAISPLILIAVKYQKTNKLELILPFSVVYPVDELDLKYYPYVFLHQLWSEIAAVLNISSADYFYFICCTYIKIQFRLLSHDFKTIIDDRRISAGLFRCDEGFKAKFSKLVIRHQTLIDFVNIIEEIFTTSTLVNFMTSSFVICLTGFNVVMGKDKTFLVPYLSFLFISLTQIFILCYIADLLMASSTQISDAIYNCNWYLCDSNIAKQLLIVLTRAQNPCKLTASGFADVNLNSFMRVLSTAWSYFALLQTMYGGNE